MKGRGIRRKNGIEQGAYRRNGHLVVKVDYKKEKKENAK